MEEMTDVAQVSDKNDPEVRAQRKLAKAQLKLHVAEEKHAQIREKGRQEVEKARLRAARWLAKSAKRVEERTAAVIRAEQRLESTAASDSQDTHVDDELAFDAPLAEQPQPPPPVQQSDSNGLVERDRRALEALRQLYHGEGVASREWRAVAEMPPTTFARARQALLGAGLIQRDGDDSREARYVLTDGR